MPVPGCFDYSDLVIQFGIRYCDPSYFALLSQNCSSYSGSFLVPYKPNQGGKRPVLRKLHNTEERNEGKHKQMETYTVFMDWKN